MKYTLCSIDGEDISIEYDEPNSMLDDLRNLQPVNMTFSSPIFDEDKNNSKEVDSIHIPTSYTKPKKDKSIMDEPVILLDRKPTKEKKKKLKS